MTKPKRSEVENRNKQPRAPGAAESAVSAVAVPRAWLVALTVLVIVPWVIAGVLYSWTEDADEATGPAVGSAADPPSPAKAGPWGQLTVTPIVISPPIEYIPRTWGSPDVSPWYLPRMTARELEQFLSSFGLDRDAIARLSSTMRPEPRTGGVVVRPDPDVLRRLDPQGRARLYQELGKSQLNHDQKTSYRYFAASPDAWFSSSLISPETRRLVEPLLYRKGDFLFFADIQLVRSALSPDELQRLAKVLLRQATMLVRLRIADATQVAPMAEYWGRGGRRTDIRPLLESIAGAGADGSIDISHLLPSFAREHLYRYPRITVTDLQKPLLANCLWTALNFFNADPDDRFLDEHFSLERLKEDYYLVHDGFQLGDIVAFRDGEGNLFHLAVYLADDLVFGKNGTTPLAPWTILPLERLKGHYVEYADQWHVSYHRRKDL
jgi:hypothetical protein